MDISQNRGGLDGGVSGLRLCDVRLPRNGDPGDPRSHGGAFKDVLRNGDFLNWWYPKII